MALTPKQERFVAEYLVDLNATAAYKRAGYAGSGHGAEVNAARLLRNAEVVAEVEKAKSKRAERVEITQDRVLKSLAQSLFFDPRKLYREDGTLKDVLELDDDTAMALAGVEVSEEFGSAGPDAELEPQPHGGGLKRLRDGRKVVVSRTAKVKWHDKTATRDQAMKHLGMFKADNVQRTPLDALPREVLKKIVERLSG